jgi:hypothetical protein
MLIAGEWRLCDDGVTRPTLLAKVQAADGTFLPEVFLVDSCADCTVLGAALLNKLHLAPSLTPIGLTLRGVGGKSDFAVVNTVLEFVNDVGGPAHVRGQFAAFTDPLATDLSILGRDVLNNFDVILSRRRNEVVLLATNHRYHFECQ